MNSIVKGYFNTDELQNLAETYNQVYKENKEAQKLIRHEAEYDSLKRAFRTIDYVCRIGGDEFAIIMVEMTSSSSFPQCGVAFTDRENPGPSIFNDADKALYHVKENGRNGYGFY